MKQIKLNPNFKDEDEQFEIKKSRVILFSAVFLFIYLTVDYLNLPYNEMTHEYGIWLVILNLALNVGMALLSGVLLALSEGLYRAKKAMLHGEKMSYVAVVFGLLTYGCTPCVISFFAVFGINFAVVALPFAGLPYKLLSLLLIVVGILWARHDLNKNSCQVTWGM